MSVSRVAVMALTTAIFVAGCGNASKTSNSTTQSSPPKTVAQTTTPSSTTEIKVSKGTPLSHAAWVARGDAICRRANEALSSTTAKSVRDFARLLPQAAAYERTEATELSKLVPPAKRAAEWQRAIGQLQKFSELSARAGEYAQANKFEEATPIAQAGNRAQIHFVAITKHEGFKVCTIP